MGLNKIPAAITVDTTIVLPDGVPPVDTRRWVASRKAAVVRAVQAGRLSIDDACRSYALSTEELEGWISAVLNHGEGALKATCFRKFR